MLAPMGLHEERRGKIEGIQLKEENAGCLC